MEKNTKPYSQMNLIIRLVAGGYLMYTAWDLRLSLTEQPLLVIAIAAFAVIGLALAVHAGWKLYKGEYEGGPGLVQPESEEEPESEEAPENEEEPV